MKTIAWHVCVLVPARNEETLLPRCLQSILKACTRLPRPYTYDVIVVADACTDQTFNLAQTILREHGTVIASNLMNVGKARKLATDIALTRFTGDMSHCWLANTDADCQVPETWLGDQLAIATQGIEAIAGIIDVDSFEDHALHVPDRFRQTYHLSADGSHPHVHGANLGVRAYAYHNAGGWANLQTGEDHDLWDRLIAQGSATLSSTSLCVLTSGRRVGRAPAGFADRLAEHNGAVYDCV